MSRISRFENKQFDIAVIGGGIIGAGVARDAALRGLSVCLLEKQDFATGTTAGSTRLIHGGLRYLEMFDFGLVRMDLREREILLRIAPHLVKPLEFLIPFYDRSLFERWKLHAGMLLYDVLSYDKTLPRYRTLDISEVVEAEPELRREGLQGGVSYFDAQVASPERLALENIVDASQHGGVALNYVEVTGALTDGGVLAGVQVRDHTTGDEAGLRARVVVNASGPWFDRVAGKIEAQAVPRIRTTKGIHLACPPLTTRAVVLYSGVDGRLFFVIPLLGNGWIGTTDTDFPGDPASAAATEEDVAYLLESAGEYFPAATDRPVYWTNSGVRALVMQAGSESDVSRSHRIEVSPGLVSILGGKITGYRAIAEEAVDAAVEQLGVRTRSSTADEILPGAKAGGTEDLREQVGRAVKEEHCFHLDDFMLRRSTLGLSADQGMEQVPEVVNYLAAELGWERPRVEVELARYQGFVDRSREYARPTESAKLS